MPLTQSAMEQLGRRLVQVAELATAYHLAINVVGEADAAPTDQAAGLRAAMRAMARSQSSSGHFAVAPTWR